MDERKSSIRFTVDISGVFLNQQRPSFQGIAAGRGVKVITGVVAVVGCGHHLGQRSMFGSRGGSAPGILSAVSQRRGGMGYYALSQGDSHVADGAGCRVGPEL